MKSIRFDTRQVRATLDGLMTETRRPFKFEPYRPGINLGFSGMSLGEYCTGDINSGVVLYSRGRGGSWNQRTKPVKPPYQKGDILYVRERIDNRPEHGNFYYHADDKGVGEAVFSALISKGLSSKKSIPSIHMPREAARIILRVTEARVERLQDITWQETLLEGIDHDNGQDDNLCNYCPIEESHRGVKNYGSGPSFCVDTGMCEEAKLHFKDDCIDCFAEIWDSVYKSRGYGWDVNPWVWVIKFERVSEVSE